VTRSPRKIQIEAIVMAIVAEASMMETRDYLLRGRRFANGSDETVTALWASAFVAWVDNPGRLGGSSPRWTMPQPSSA
jgi:hypothetical protein